MEDLVRRAVGGDAHAIEQLIRETTGSVRTVVLSYVKDHDEASDIVQEVFLRAIQRLDSLDDPARFRPWIYAIARNAGLDHLRHARRRVGLPGPNMEAQDPVDPDAGPEVLAEVRELAERVRVGIMRLNPRDATLLAMVCTLGFTPTDVAGALGMTPTAAKVAIHRARQRLRNAMLLETTMTSGAVERATGCEDFQAYVAKEELVEAALHARACAVCTSGARPVSRA